MLAIILLFSTKLFLLEKQHENYNGSYIQIFGVNTNKKSLLNINNVENVIEIVELKLNGEKYIVCYDDTLTLLNNEIILPNDLKKTLNIGDEITLEFNEQKYSFQIKTFHDKNAFQCYLIINKKMFESLFDKESSKDFLIELYDWSKVDHTIKKIKKKSNCDKSCIVYKFIHQEKKNNHDILVIIINIATISMIVILSMVIMITCYNLVIDESKKHYLYSCLGYTQKKIFFIKLTKILSVIFISLIFTVAVYLFASKILRILF